MKTFQNMQTAPRKTTSDQTQHLHACKSSCLPLFQHTALGLVSVFKSYYSQRFLKSLDKITEYIKGTFANVPLLPFFSVTVFFKSVFISVWSLCPYLKNKNLQMLLLSLVGVAYPASLCEVPKWTSSSQLTPGRVWTGCLIYMSDFMLGLLADKQSELTLLAV